jgi:hypothetical protein
MNLPSNGYFRNAVLFAFLPRQRGRSKKTIEI